MQATEEFTDFLDKWKDYCHQQSGTCHLIAYTDLVANTHDVMDSIFNILEDLEDMDIPRQRLACIHDTSIASGSFQRTKHKKSDNYGSPAFGKLDLHVQKEACTHIKDYLSAFQRPLSTDFDKRLSEVIMQELDETSIFYQVDHKD